MSTQPIDVILFDLGGVLIELAGVEKMLEWSPGVGTTEELWRRWLYSDAVRKFETGRIAAASWLGSVARQVAGVDGARRAFREVGILVT